MSIFTKKNLFSAMLSAILACCLILPLGSENEGLIFASVMVGFMTFLLMLYSNLLSAKPSFEEKYSSEQETDNKQDDYEPTEEDFKNAEF